MSRAALIRDRPATVTAAIVVGVLVLAGLVAILVAHARGPVQVIPALRGGPAYPARLVDGTVLAGDATADQPRIDIYEDPLCPACGHLEQQVGTALRTALAAHQVTVRYHLINFLDPLSQPPGYPLTAANAMLCAAEAGIFPDYHASLYAAQPREGTPGYTLTDLAQLGTTLGAPPDFATCVRTGRHNQQVRDQLAAFRADANLRVPLPSGTPALGTPTVVIDGIPTTQPAQAILGSL
jgi:protein-disulfide isomerase